MSRVFLLPLGEGGATRRMRVGIAEASIQPRPSPLPLSRRERGSRKETNA